MTSLFYRNVNCIYFSIKRLHQQYFYTFGYAEGIASYKPSEPRKFSKENYQFILPIENPPTDVKNDTAVRPITPAKKVFSFESIFLILATWEISTWNRPFLVFVYRLLIPEIVFPSNEATLSG